MGCRWAAGGIVFVAALLVPAVGAAEPAKPAVLVAAAGPVRQAVARSLVFLEREGLAWLEQRKCIACHHAPYLLWSHHEARRRGLPVDARKMDAWVGRSLDLYLVDRKKHETARNGCVEALAMLLGRVAPARDQKDEAFRVVTALLTNGQRPDGSWRYEGQGLKRPDAEGHEATTLWALLALAGQSDPALRTSRERALAWLKGQPTGQGNESVALRVAVEARLGDPARARELARVLLGRQQADGGWGWAPGRPSDAFATGQSLYALAAAGWPAADPAMQRARAFLLGRQLANGSWYSPSRKPPGKDNPIAVYWGTAWAAIGLLHTLPPAQP